MSENLISVGSFKCPSGKLRLSDPCFGRDSSEGEDYLSAVVEGMAKGTWDAFVKYCPKTGRVSSLVVISNKAKGEPDADFIEDLCVDTGTMGIFDDSRFDESQDYTVLVDNPAEAGTDKFAAVAMSGFGDGLYTAAVWRNKSGLGVLVEIEFIPEETEQ